MKRSDGIAAMAAAGLLAGVLLAGCGGDSGRSGGGPPHPPGQADLPSLQRDVGIDNVPGICTGKLPVNAVGLPGVPGEGALGPAGEPVDAGPVFFFHSNGPPRVAHLTDRRGERWIIDGAIIAKASYQGPLVVIGDRIDGPGSLSFDGAKLLDLPEGTGEPWRRSLSGRETAATGWRYLPVPVAVGGPGCYAIGVKGEGFEYSLAFGADLG